jgi:hypothetical protein
MSHPILGASLVARGTLVVTIACLYAGAVLFNNNLLFPWLEFDNFRNLLFLPAGLKLFLVMLFGWRAVAGIGLGLAAVALSEFPHMPMSSAFFLGAVAALSTQLTLQAMSPLLRVGYPWTQLRWPSLCAIALVVGSVDAITVQWLVSVLGYETFDSFLTETLKGVFGRVVGTFVFLAVSLEVRRHLSQQPLNE